MDTLPSVSDSLKERDVAAFLNTFTQVALTTGSIGVARVSRHLRDSTHLDCFGYSWRIPLSFGVVEFVLKFEKTRISAQTIEFRVNFQKD